MNARVEARQFQRPGLELQCHLAVSGGQAPASAIAAVRGATALSATISVNLTGSYRAEALIEPPLVVDYEDKRRGSPICDLARKLVKAGYDPGAQVLIWRNGTLCFNPAPLRVWAKLRAVERDNRSARIETWDAMPKDKVAKLTAAKQ